MLKDGYYGGHNDLVLDQQGKPHISCSFNDTGDEDLLYFNNKYGEFANHKDLMSIGLHNVLAIDDNKKAHILHWFWNNGETLYTSNASGLWETSLLGVNLFPYTILNSSEGISAFYWDNNKLMHTYLISSKWSAPENILNKTGIFYSISAVVHGCRFYVFTYPYIISGNNGNWESFNLSRFLPSSTYSNCHTSKRALAVDLAGNIHVCLVWHDDKNRGIIYYASNCTGNWQMKVIDNQNNLAWIGTPFLATDSAGNVHMTYIHSHWNEDPYKLLYLKLVPKTFFNNYVI